jgi:hypothetical protein
LQDSIKTINPTFTTNSRRITTPFPKGFSR